MAKVKREFASKACNAKLDGFDPVTKTIVQVHGCFLYGHDKCYQAHMINQVKGVSMGTLLIRVKLNCAGFKKLALTFKSFGSAKSFE